VRVGCELRLFDLLVEKGEMTLDELVKETGAAKVLLGKYYSDDIPTEFAWKEKEKGGL
jgi:hypothetical protein